MSESTRTPRLHEVAIVIDQLKARHEKGDSEATNRLARIKRAHGRKDSIEQIFFGLSGLLSATGYDNSAHFSEQEEAILMELAPLQATDDQSSGDILPLAIVLDRAFSVGSDRRASIERRMLALLQSRQQGLSKHLKPLLAMLATKQDEVRINWSLLYEDAYYWDRPKRIHKKKWARQFFLSNAAQRNHKES